VTDPLPPLAHREIRRAAQAHLAAPRTLAGLAAVALLLGLSGPFDTVDALGFPARLAYWAVIVAGSYAIGTLVVLALTGRVMRPAARRAAETALTATGASLLVAAATAVAIGATGRGLAGWAILVAEVCAVTAVVVVLRDLVAGRRAAGRPRDGGAGAPPLLRRLPVAARGPLVALRATDHYVEVTTTAGRALVLMRLRDAIAEAAPTPGLQVHRSHWVAVGRVAGVARRGDGALLRLETGDDIPVSRSYMSAVRSAGLLPVRPGKGHGGAQE